MCPAGPLGTVDLPTAVRDNARRMSSSLIIEGLVQLARATSRCTGAYPVHGASRDAGTHEGRSVKTPAAHCESRPAWTVFTERFYGSIRVRPDPMGRMRLEAGEPGCASSSRLLSEYAQSLRL